MSVIYKKIQQIIGPLIFLKNEHDAQYGEIVKIKTNDNTVVKIDTKNIFGIKGIYFVLDAPIIRINISKIKNNKKI